MSSSLLIAGICLNIFFICGGDRVAWKLWGPRYFSREGTRGFSKQLATCMQVLHKFYFDFTFDWTSFTLYNNPWASFLHPCSWPYQPHIGHINMNIILCCTNVTFHFTLPSTKYHFVLCIFYICVLRPWHIKIPKDAK